MSDGQIVNTILVVVGLAIFGVNVIRKLGGAAARLVASENPAQTAQPQAQVAPAPTTRRRVTQPVAQRFAPVVPEAVRLDRPARAPMPAHDQSFPAEAADAFPTLDLTLPDAAAPVAGAPARPQPRPRRNGLVPGNRSWGAGAIVALEILGPPVSLRSGATLGAPHAF